MTPEERIAEIDEIIAAAAMLPLRDAACYLWRQRPRLNTLEGRPTPEQVRAYRALSPAQQSAALRHDRDFAQDGPSFIHLQRAYPKASAAEVKQAIISAVKFDDACFRHFSNDHDLDFWERCVTAVACARKENPGYLDSTYQTAERNVAYYMK